LICTDDDECTLGTDNCDENATCNNTDGSFTCSCNAGYTGDGLTCTADVVCTDGEAQSSTTPCPHPVEGPFWYNEFCQNNTWTQGMCGWNYCGIGADNCSANSTCSNTKAGWYCDCNAGYSVSGGCASGTCVMAGAGTTCYCSAFGGTAGDTDDALICTDDDECTLGTDNCDENATCNNTDGSFSCDCNSGYTGDGVTCTADNPCEKEVCDDESCQMQGPTVQVVAWIDEFDCSGPSFDSLVFDVLQYWCFEAQLPWCEPNTLFYWAFNTAIELGLEELCKSANIVDPQEFWPAPQSFTNYIATQQHRGASAAYPVEISCLDGVITQAPQKCGYWLDHGYTPYGPEGAPLEYVSGEGKSAGCFLDSGGVGNQCAEYQYEHKMRIEMPDFAVDLLGVGFDVPWVFHRIHYKLCCPGAGEAQGEYDISVEVSNFPSHKAYIDEPGYNADENNFHGSSIGTHNQTTLPQFLFSNLFETPVPVDDLPPAFLLGPQTGDVKCEITAPSGGSGDGSCTTEPIDIDEGDLCTDVICNPDTGEVTYEPLVCDECTLGTDNCDENATCNNTDGSFTCSCNAGYTGDGVTCTADNPCEKEVCDDESCQMRGPKVQAIAWIDEFACSGPSFDALADDVFDYWCITLQLPACNPWLPGNMLIREGIELGLAELCKSKNIVDPQDFWATKKSFQNFIADKQHRGASMLKPVQISCLDGVITQAPKKCLFWNDHGNTPLGGEGAPLEYMPGEGKSEGCLLHSGGVGNQCAEYQYEHKMRIHMPQLLVVLLGAGFDVPWVFHRIHYNLCCPGAGAAQGEYDISVEVSNFPSHKAYIHELHPEPDANGFWGSSIGTHNQTGLAEFSFSNILEPLIQFDDLPPGSVLGPQTGSVKCEITAPSGGSGDGSCTTEPIDIDEGDLCTDVICNPDTGEVTYEPLVCDGSDDPCESTECDSSTGQCTITQVVCPEEDPPNPCTDNECVPGVGCVYPPNCPCEGIAPSYSFTFAQEFNDNTKAPCPIIGGEAGFDAGAAIAITIQSQEAHCSNGCTSSLEAEGNITAGAYLCKESLVLEGTAQLGGSKKSCPDCDETCKQICKGDTCDSYDFGGEAKLTYTQFYGYHKLPTDGAVQLEIKCGAPLSGTPSLALNGSKTKDNGYQCGICTDCLSSDATLGFEVAAEVGCYLGFSLFDGLFTKNIGCETCGHLGLDIYGGAQGQTGECGGDICAFSGAKAKAKATTPCLDFGVAWFGISAQCSATEEACAEASGCGTCSSNCSGCLGSSAGFSCNVSASGDCN